MLLYCDYERTKQARGIIMIFNTEKSPAPLDYYGTREVTRMLQALMLNFGDRNHDSVEFVNVINPNPSGHFQDRQGDIVLRGSKTIIIEGHEVVPHFSITRRDDGTFVGDIYYCNESGVTVLLRRMTLTAKVDLVVPEKRPTKQKKSKFSRWAKKFLRMLGVRHKTKRSNSDEY